MNSLDAVFLECEQSHFFERFGSFVTAKKSNKGEEFTKSKGGERLEEFLENGSATILCDKKLGESIFFCEKLSMCYSF